MNKLIILFLILSIILLPMYVESSQTKKEEKGQKTWQTVKDEVSAKNLIEKIGHARMKMKRKFPVVLALIGVAAVVVLIFILGKKDDDSGSEIPQLAKEVYESFKWQHIPAGKFKMGDNFGFRISDEWLVHTVYLDEYYISKYEVTFNQYDKFCEDTNRIKPDDEGWGRRNRPVIHVSWNDAKAFCDWLSEKTGYNVHLPTEAQWEKAARGTDQRKYPWGNSTPTCRHANTLVCHGKTMPVGSHPDGQSPYGVHDMAGNVREWCSDWYDRNYYANSPLNNPTGPLTGLGKVYRDGDYYYHHGHSMPFKRHHALPTTKIKRLGFRIARSK